MHPTATFEPLAQFEFGLKPVVGPQQPQGWVTAPLGMPPGIGIGSGAGMGIATVETELDTSRPGRSRWAHAKKAFPFS